MRIIAVYDKNFTPEYKTNGSICMDLKSAYNTTIQPWKTEIIATWVKTNFPSKIYPRSSLCIKKNLIMPNSVWIIDEDYRWEVWVILHNIWLNPVTILAWERIAQMETLDVYSVAEDDFWDDIQEIRSIKFVDNQENDEVKIISRREWYDFWKDEDLERTWWFWSTWSF